MALMEYNNILINVLQPSQVEDAINLIQRVFLDAVAPYFSEKGVEEFLRYAEKDKLLNRQSTNHFCLIADYNGTIVGIIEVRNYDHVSLFFVDSAYQRRGIGSALCQHAVDFCVANKSDVHSISVNASPNAILAYERMGFKPTDKENLVNGIRFTPMSMAIHK